MDMAMAKVVYIIRTEVSIPSASIPVYSEVVTAPEAQVSLVLLHLALNSLWHFEAEVHQAQLAGPAREQVAPVEPPLRLQGLKLKEIVSTNNSRGLSGVSVDCASTMLPRVYKLD